MEKIKFSKIQWKIPTIDNESVQITIMDEEKGFDYYTVGILRDFFSINGYQKAKEREDLKAHKKRIEAYNAIWDAAEFIYEEAKDIFEYLSEAQEGDIPDIVLKYTKKITLKEKTESDELEDCVIISELIKQVCNNELSPRQLLEIDNKFVRYMYYRRLGKEYPAIEKIIEIFIYLKKENRLNRLGYRLYLAYLAFVVEKRQDNETADSNNIINDIVKNIRYISYFRDIFYEFYMDLGMHQYQEAETICYLMTSPISQKQFHNKTRDIFYILSETRRYRDRYLNGEKSQEGHYSKLVCDSETYFAISGDIANEERNAAKLIEELGKEKMLADNKDKVRYYYDGCRYVESGKYIQLKENSIDLPQETKRLFSCCERKLLTVLYKRGTASNLIIYINKAPCYMCKDALERAEAEYNSKITIKYTYYNNPKLDAKSNRHTEKQKEMFNEIANQINVW